MKLRCNNDDDVISASMLASSASNARAGGRGVGGDDNNGEAIKILDSTTYNENRNETKNNNDTQMRIMWGCHPCNVGCGGLSSLSSLRSSSPVNAAAGCINNNMADKDGNAKEGED